MGQALSKRRKIFRSDERLKEALLDLKETTENVRNNPDISLRGGVYKEMVDAEMFAVTLNNLEVGYEVVRNPLEPLTEVRKVFVLLHGYKFSEIPDDVKDPMMGAIFDVFLERTSDMPDIEAAGPNLLILSQKCVRPDVLAGQVIQ